MPLTPSEQLTYDLCKKSFLSLWSYANPQQPNGKELADVVAVFGHHVIVFSVKEIALKEHADPAVAAQRWVRKAVDESVDQLRGAKRVLARMEHVIRSDGSIGVQLPPASDRVVHLVAVAAGGKREVPFTGGGKDGEYVHVLDEAALRAIMSELDTAPDFIHYLSAKECWQGVMVYEGEENLFAHYLHSGRKFPQLDMMLVEDGLWSQLQQKPEFKARKLEDQKSYWWDERIERLIEDCVIPLEAAADMNKNELLVRTMASESRFERRILSSAFLDWLMMKEPGGRFAYSPATGIGYVLQTSPRDHEREYRVANLTARCLLARSPNGPLARAGYQVQKVIGIATEVYEASGWSMDVVYFDQPTWTDDDDRVADEGRKLFGLMSNPVYRRGSFDEFPIQHASKASGPPRRSDGGRRKAKRKEAKKSRRRNR